jgi:hypothetical protein
MPQHRPALWGYIGTRIEVEIADTNGVAPPASPLYLDIHVESNQTADCRPSETDPGKATPFDVDPGGLVVTHIFEPRKVQALGGDPARGAGPVSSAVSSAPL